MLHSSGGLQLLHSSHLGTAKIAAIAATKLGWSPCFQVSIETIQRYGVLDTRAFSRLRGRQHILAAAEIVTLVPEGRVLVIEGGHQREITYLCQELWRDLG